MACVARAWGMRGFDGVGGVGGSLHRPRWARGVGGLAMDGSVAVRPGAAPLVVANVYVTEGRDEGVLEALRARVASFGARVLLLHQFVDVAYGRTGFTVGGPPRAVEDAVAGLVGEALARVDLAGAPGTHPRTGAVDHVAVHPVGGGATLACAAEAARAVARRIGAGPPGSPVYLYGEASSPAGRRLVDVRRAIGYFGASPPDFGALPPPDFGALPPRSASGVVCVGATKLVLNLNVPLATSSGEDAAFVTSAARSPCVQAMALPHGDGVIEVACNLLDVDQEGVDEVRQRIHRAADQRGVKLHAPGYLTGLDAAQLEDRLLQHFHPHEAE